MCVVSMVINQGIRDWGPFVVPQTPTVPDMPVFNPPVPTALDHETVQIAFDKLQELMWKAAEYDRLTGQNKCEHADKIRALRAIADALAVKIEIPGEDRLAA